MNKVVELKPKRKAARAEVATDEFFGGCPLCGRNDALLHVGKGHWSVCREHQTRWDVGSMFKFDPGKDEELWSRNASELLACRVVHPILPGPNGVEDAAERTQALLALRDGTEFLT